MALGYLRELELLKSTLQPENRFTDISLRFWVVERGSDDKPFRTGECSPALGGVWDSWQGEYVGPSASVLDLECTAKQFELIFCRNPRIEGNGGRGSGKSEGGVLWCLRKIVEQPFSKGQIVAPTYDIVSQDWDKLLEQIPSKWLLPGKEGILLSKRTLMFAHGVALRFRSSDNPDSLRSWGGHWSWVDEEQDAPTKALSVIWPSLRLSSEPQMLTTGTPKPGEYYDRHQKLLRDPVRNRCIRFDSFSNAFIPLATFEQSKFEMDEQTYRQEILAEWLPVEDLARILHGFDRGKHQIAWPPKRGLDITREVVKRRAAIYADYVAGVDYNWDWPNYALIMKVVADVDCEFDQPMDDVRRQHLIRKALADSKLQHWCVVDVVSSRGSHAGFLGAEIKKRGYEASQVFVVDDAAGQQRRNNKLSSSKLLRMEGFHVSHPGRNPSIRDAVNAVNAKLAPMEGEPTLHVALPQCEELAVAAELGIWNKTGKEFDKTHGHDHLIDALKYAISFFCPIRDPYPVTQRRVSIR